MDETRDDVRDYAAPRIEDRAPIENPLIGVVSNQPL
jgi:hypothetical protein